MTHIPANATVTASASALVQDLPGDEIVIMSTATEEYFGLRGTGARMWTELSRGHTVDVVAHEVAAEYDVEVDRVRADLLELLADLVAAGLVVVDAG